ncbi:MAG: LCP family protein [Oscillospiraceae bacterium]|nr:LCP family protein [Oscillospiraceae bacterium]
MKENAKNRKLKKIILILLIVLLALILTAALAFTLITGYLFNRLGSAVQNETISVIPPHMEDFETDPPITTQEPTTVPADETQPSEGNDPTQPTTQPPATEPPPPPTRPDFDWPEVEKLQSDDVINILLVGKDASSADGRPRTDSMILLSINKRTNSLSMVSLMRDLYVQIPGGYSDNRINAAYRFGGIDLLNATIEKNFGIVIDGNIEVDFQQFATIINILGGVEIELTQAEASYMQRLGFSKIVAGKNLLGGEAALQYCRIRMIDSDHQRTERQRKLLLIIADRAQDMSISQVWEMIDKVLPYVRTDMSEKELVSVTTAGVQALLSGNGIRSSKVPQSGHYYGANIMGMQVMVPNLYQCNQYLKSFIYG